MHSEYNGYMEREIPACAGMTNKSEVPQVLSLLTGSVIQNLLLITALWISVPLRCRQQYHVQVPRLGTKLLHHEATAELRSGVPSLAPH